MMLRASTTSRFLARRTLSSRLFASAADESSGSSSGAPQPRLPRAGYRQLPPHEAWRDDTETYHAMHNLPGGRQVQRDFKMGHYASTWRMDPKTKKVTPYGVWFVSPKKDPVTFVVNLLCALTVVWAASSLSWGESFIEKRRRVLRERIRQEYGLPKGWEHDIEDSDLDVDLGLSDAVPSGSVSLPTSTSST
mmetsp:Transcript_64447/g.119890  ORF Transcript_64447/g.119890 Transcript_64447/m.119890 type:complete len:192 (+) Transcript_64447:79-654(+)